MNPLSFYKKLKMVFNRDERLLFTVKEFAHANKDLLIIVSDPKSDRMFVTYKDKFVNGRIKSATGKKTHVVREVLKHSRFKESIDQYLASLVETLHLPVWKSGANQFYQFIDGAIFNIAKSMKKRQESPPDPLLKQKGAIPSPFVGKSD